MQPSPGEHSERSRGNARGLWARPVTQLGSRGEEAARRATPRDPPPPWAVRGPSGSLCANWRARCEFRDTRETLVLSAKRPAPLPRSRQRKRTRAAPACRTATAARRAAGGSSRGGGRGAHAHGNTNSPPGPARPWGPRDRPVATGRGLFSRRSGPSGWREGPLRAGRAGRSQRGRPRAGSAEGGPQASGHSAESSRAQSRRHRGCSRFSDGPGPGLRGGGGATHVACQCSPGA